MNTAAAGPFEKPAPSMRTVIVASSAGTAFEWYDFFVYGSLTAIISRKFFAQLDETSATLAALAVFAVGLLFRPMGALIFGRLGDRFGRKGAFLATVLIMGGATFAIGLLPDDPGMAGVGTVLLILLRILQGMAVGGEYGGAAIYVAEHSSANRRGTVTSWIQSSAAFGLMGALAVVLTARTVMGEDAFSDWGWRIPFLVSALLVGVSIWMRLKLNESPEFERMKAEGRVSKAPYAEAFLRWSNLKVVLIALFAILMPQGAIWWCAFSYSQIFLETFMKLPGVWANMIMIGATFASIPLYIFFGWLSDRVGRKPILLLGMILAVVSVFPAFKTFSAGANAALLEAQTATPVQIHADPAACSFQFDLLGRKKYETGCDIARSVLTKAGVGYETLAVPAGQPTTVSIGDIIVETTDAVGADAKTLTAHAADIDGRLKAVLKQSGFPASADPAQINWVLVIGGFSILVIAACALYGPMAASLVELFPTNVRYTALSVPYHVGVGWVGGFMPMTAFAVATATGNIFAGLWYPVIFGTLGIIVCLLFYPETKGRPLID